MRVLEWPKSSTWRPLKLKNELKDAQMWHIAVRDRVNSGSSLFVTVSTCFLAWLFWFIVNIKILITVASTKQVKHISHIKLCMCWSYEQTLQTFLPLLLFMNCSRAASKLFAHTDYEMWHQLVVWASGTVDTDSTVQHIKRVQFCHPVKFTDSPL